MCNVPSHIAGLKKDRCSGIHSLFLSTLSPISETNMSVNAAVNPDFAMAAKSDEGPPLPNTINEYTKAHPISTRAIERG